MRKHQPDLLKKSKAYRQVLQELLRARLKSETDKKELAKFLGKSVVTVNKMIYEGAMGLDVWVVALEWAYKLDAESMRQYIVGMPELLRSAEPLSVGDQLWLELGSALSEKEKIHYGNLIKCAMDANKVLEGKRPRKRR